MAAYAHPEALVSTQWVADHLHDPHIHLLEAGWDTATYASGHIPGAIGVGIADLHQPDSIDILSKPELEALLSRAGVAPDDTVVLYGEVSNLIATLAFWLLIYYGHADVRLLDGGRQHWVAEGRVLTTDLPVVRPTTYLARNQTSCCAPTMTRSVACSTGRDTRWLMRARRQCTWATTRAGRHAAGTFPARSTFPPR